MTRPAAREQAGWPRRLDRHPRTGKALATAEISPSRAKLLAAAAAGLPLEDIARLAQEMYERSSSQPDDDQPFRDRQVRLETTFGGAGKLTGDLSPQCAAIMRKIPDAIQGALRRLIKSGRLPGSAGTDTRAMVVMPLSQLRQMPGASALENTWITARAGECGWLSGPGAAAAACDAEITPVVTGTVDWQAADQLTQAWIDARALEHRQPCGCTCGGCTCTPPAPLPPETRARLTSTLLRLAADALSGPAGLAGYLRTRLPGTGYPTASLPLDAGTSDKIPEAIRRAVILRDRHCAWPGGCDKPPAGCHIHHLIPKAQGGTTRLTGLILLCEFHHQACVHRFGWKLTLHPDGSTEAISPWGQILRSHGPPTAQAA